MPLSPDTYIRCVSDGWLAVRDRTGRLLGAIPSGPPDGDFIPAPLPLGAVAVWSALTFCAVPDPEQIPMLRQWPGFVPVDDLSAQADLAVPVGGSAPDQEDLGTPP